MLSLKKKKYYSDNREQFRSKFKLYYSNNKVKHRICYKQRYASNSTEIQKKARETRRVKREKVISHYSPDMKCINCGEARFECLAIDHIKNDGRKHIKEIGRSSFGLCLWIINNNFPSGFQILCHNCNFRKYVLLVESSSTYSKSRIQIKNEVLGHYSDGETSCVHCGINDIRVLTVDHKNNGGRIHRKRINMTRGGSQFYRWLKLMGYPPGYQTMCMNCNLGKWITGDREVINVDDVHIDF